MRGGHQRLHGAAVRAGQLLSLLEHDHAAVTNCSILFGNVASGPGVNNYGGFAQYGADLRPFIGYDEFESTPRAAIC